MELFNRLFSRMLVFVYHCFDRVFRKGTQHLTAVRLHFLPITNHSASFEAQAPLKTFGLLPHSHPLAQLRYDLRKMKPHGLIQRDPQHDCYCLPEKGIKTSLLFLLFHKRIRGPMANSLFQFRPSLNGHSKSKLEAVFHKTDQAIQETIDLLAA